MTIFYLILSVCFALFITIESRSAAKTYTEELTNVQKTGNPCRNLTNLDIMEFTGGINKTIEEMNGADAKDAKSQIGCFIACLLQEQGYLNGTVLNTNKLSDVVKMALDSSEETPRLQNELDMVMGIIRDCGKQVENMTDVCMIGWTFGMCGGHIFGI